MYDKLLEKLTLTDAYVLQDFGLAGFIHRNGQLDEFDPTEEHWEHGSLDKGEVGGLEYRIFPAGMASSDDVLILRLNSPLTSEQVISLNKLLNSTDYTIDSLEVEFLTSLVGGPKSIRTGMTKDWASIVRKEYEERSKMFASLFEKLIRVDEAVATVIVDLQKEIKDYYKGKSTKLTKSSFENPNEANWYKFWILTDGIVIPVDYSHRDTIRNATRAHFETDPRLEFLDTGAVAGFINGADLELNIQSVKKLTKQQIFQLRNIGIEYKVISIVADIGRKDWSASVESSKHLDYLLNYGPMDEAKTDEDEKEQFFVDRIEKHIQLVQGAAAKIVDAYPEFDELLKQVEVHDQSKLEEPEKTPYIEITWRHKLENEEGEYDPYNGKGYQIPGQLEKEDENKATVHHITTNSHHPEYHLEDKSDANVDMDDRSKLELVDAHLMSPSDIAEMVADWQAMSEELQTNTAREWFDKQKDVRWHFTEEQEELISKLLTVFEEERDG